ncbi:protein CUP-SHAPED COTYLEDON 2-like [Zingiber officinale]|uniref:NAC domain-containing protein n=1 Tax=Zingiber officinale TaxID=94328 RepID=A0A8J5F269_ZINOF|nr:protein CUP-SHAPED COTYLEDON 2-like [Zingiber officinale]KAG6480185.1 hypothetical protein ZIOFF_063663 [Zingiber officinale]
MENHVASESQLPPGFRFHPTDEELITHYLLKKVLDVNFAGRAIAEIDLNKCEPWELPEKAKMGEKEWYFFSLRDRKYPTGLRTNRATDAGYWKATGKDREIYSSKATALVGMKKTLVFYRGRAPKGEKSNWVMHEYRLEGKFAYHFLSRSFKEEWVVSRVFQKCGGGGSSGKRTRFALAGESAAVREAAPVPCFSTTVSFMGLHFPPAPPSGFAGGFQSLRSLQENLHLPFLIPSAPGPPPAIDSAGSGWPSDFHRTAETSDAVLGHQLPVGSTELDCVWSF